MPTCLWVMLCFSFCLSVFLCLYLFICLSLSLSLNALLSLSMWCYVSLCSLCLSSTHPCSPCPFTSFAGLSRSFLLIYPDLQGNAWPYLYSSSSPHMKGDAVPAGCSPSPLTSVPQPAWIWPSHPHNTLHFPFFPFFSIIFLRPVLILTMKILFTAKSCASQGHFSFSEQLCCC